MDERPWESAGQALGYLFRARLATGAVPSLSGRLVHLMAKWGTTDIGRRPPSSDLPERRAWKADLERAWARFVDRWPQSAEMVVLCFEDNLAGAAIANRLGLTTAAVYQRKARAIGRFGSVLKDMGLL